jgi:hypothetical protein
VYGEGKNYDGTVGTTGGNSALQRGKTCPVESTVPTPTPTEYPPRFWPFTASVVERAKNNRRAPDVTVRAVSEGRGLRIGLQAAVAFLPTIQTAARHDAIRFYHDALKKKAANGREITPTSASTLSANAVTRSLERASGISRASCL